MLYTFSIVFIFYLYTFIFYLNTIINEKIFCRILNFVLSRYLFLYSGRRSASITAAKIFTRQDTLRGSITPERAWWDLTYYHLDIAVSPADSTINGTNTVTYRVLKPLLIMQIDLQEPLN